MTNDLVVATSSRNRALTLENKRTLSFKIIDTLMLLHRT